MNTLVANGKFLDLSIPKIMGIVNLTPDSFHRGSRVESVDEALQLVQQMINDGADMIDIGGQSSRPRADRISPEEEWNRMKEALREIRSSFPDILLSIDTYYAAVAEEAIGCGVDIINDISSGTIDDRLIDVIADNKVGYVLMHMLGTPMTMQDDPTYANVVLDILNFIKDKKHQLEKRGIQNLIIDPGFGFGKTVDQNYELLRKLHVFSIIDAPLMVGLSRKSMIYKVLNCESAEALNGTSVLHMKALDQGAKILRVHDVKEARETITLHAKVVGKLNSI